MEINSEDIRHQSLERSVSNHKAQVVWNSTLNCCQIVQLKGKFWTKFGVSFNGMNILYPEEALYLLDRHAIELENHTPTMSSAQHLHDEALKAIPLPLFLAYLKLKSLEYIIVRHSKIARVFADDAELYDHLRTNPAASILDSLVCYKLYVEPQSFSKRDATSGRIAPVAFVAVVDGPCLLSPRVLLTLLAEASPIPIIIAAVTSTGIVTLQEFTDATQTLDLGNDTPIERKPKRRKIVAADNNDQLTVPTESDDKREVVEETKETKNK